MTERIIADCLSLSRFTGAFLFDNSELFLWGSSDLDDYDYGDEDEPEDEDNPDAEDEDI